MSGSFLDNLTGAYSGLRRSVIDPETGRALVTSEPTGRIHERAPFAPVGIDDSGRMVPAVPGFIADAPQAIASAVTLPRDAWRGEVETMPTRMSLEEGQRVADLAGLVMTGSLPFKAPKGALRMFGGAAKDADDPFAALEAALAQGTKNAEPALPPGPTRVDPNAKSWDLYHGSEAGPDFRRFDPYRGEAHSESGALFLASEGDTASMYAGSGLDRLRDGYEQNLLENFTRDREIAAQLAEMGLPPSERTGVSFGYGHIGAALQQAREEGLDTAIIRGLAEHGGEDQVAVLTPNRVRSRYSGDLLYSTAPAAAAAGGATAAVMASGGEAKAAAGNEGKPMPGLFDDLMPDGQSGAKPEAAPKAKAGGLFDDLAPPAASPMEAPQAVAAGDASAAVGRGIINGVPVVGPYLLAGVNRAAAGVRSLQNDTRFSDELRNVEAFGEATAKENPGSTIGGELAGGVLGTAPLVAAAPAAFGAGAASLPVRMLASAGSGGTLGAADSAVRSDGDVASTAVGGALGVGLGAAAPAIGAGVGRVVGAFTSRGRSNGVMQEALEGISDKDLASAQHLIEQARSLPGGGVALTLDEALNAVTGGQATRASQLARVVGNSGGEGGRIMGEFYAARPASVDNVGRAGFERVAPINRSPTGLGFDLQDAARAGVAQTPEGQTLASARRAQAERVTPEQAGRAMQEDLGGVRDLRDAARSSRANVDYRLAREAPETVGVERTVRVERPGEPVVTRPEGAPRFTDAAPRPLDPPPTVEASASVAPESLARFVARHGGIRLDGDAAATDLHRFNIPGLGNVARESGKGIDNFWRERLIEAGYFRPDADGGAARDITNELLRKLQNEQRGFPSYPVDAERAAATARGQQGRVTDEYRAALSEVESRLDEALNRAGVPPESLHPEIRSRTLGAMLRGEASDPLDAYERTIAGMVDPPAPYSRSTTVTEEIPDVRFGQVDPRPALAAVAEQGRTAKGDVRGSLGAVERNLREPGGDLDLSVAGNLHTRERLDMDIRAAREIGDGTKVRDLTITRNALDGALKRVPEVATADANFARNSAPLAPFERPNAPLNRATAREDVPGTAPGPFRTPAEQVPEIFAGPTALREALANGGAATRQAAERRLSTRILDSVTDANGDVSADALRKAMRESADVLDQLPAVRDRLSGLVLAREGMARVEATPLGRIAERPEVKNAIAALFPANPLANSQDEITAAVQALARNNPRAARDLVRVYMETAFNEATQELRGVARQYGGAGFASAIRGNGQQRHNLEAAIRALPEGDTLWTGLDRMLTTLEATGYRPQKGSDTAFNQAIQARLKEGAGTVGQAVNDVVAGAAAGATVGGPKGALGGALVGGRRGGAKVLQERRVQMDSEAIARILTDPRAASMLRSLAREKPGSRGAEILTTKLLQIGGRGVGSGDQSSTPSR